MNLWTEYEGRTIADAYNLRKLLRSEGRNAFFATSTGKGNAAVIRLTEAHFDEEETLKRWHQVAEVHQANLIRIEQTGKTTFDGVALTYAVLEPNDADLEDVLKERPLTTAETAQVASSVCAALAALHANGLVHEHVEPANVLAVGEVVKLRSDCVRECVGDVEFPTQEGCDELRRRDIHDFGILLLRCLTLEKVWSPSINLPEPFKQIIPHAIDGGWTLDRIAAALDSESERPKPATSVLSENSPAMLGARAPSVKSREPVRRDVRQGSASVEASAESSVESAAAMPLAPEPSTSFRPRNQIESAESERSAFKPVWLVYGAVALLVIVLAWHFLSHNTAKPVVSVPAASNAATAPVATPAAAPVVAAPVASAAAEPRASAIAAAPSHSGWYVIAFTYNHEDQARTKAARLNARHLPLHAQVFSPTGHAPYLVSLDGAMNKEEGQAVLRRARRSGLPRDTFLRRY